jgi:hypothetical protein
MKIFSKTNVLDVLYRRRRARYGKIPLFLSEDKHNKMDGF